MYSNSGSKGQIYFWCRQEVNPGELEVSGINDTVAYKLLLHKRLGVMPRGVIIPGRADCSDFRSKQIRGAETGHEEPRKRKLSRYQSS